MKKSLLKILICILFIILLTSCDLNIINVDTSDKFVNFAYSTKSTVLHKISCGEVKHIKIENYAETNNSLPNLLSNGFRLCKVCFRNYDKAFMQTENIVRFQQCLKSEFNFLPFNERNNEILNMLTDLYVGISEAKESCYDANIEYHRLLASIVYHDDNSSYSNFDWQVTSNLYGSKNEILSAMKSYFLNIYKNPDTIYGDKYLEHLFDSVIQQYDLASISNNKNDIAHLSATLCAIDNEPNVSKQVSRYASLYNGIDGLGMQAGYIGDVCGTNGKEPSLNIPDYRADLDAVNLSQIYKRNKNDSIFTVLTDYYINIKSQGLNRAVTFINNVSKDILEQQRVLYNNYLLTKYQKSEYEYCNRINYFDNFLQHIYNAEQDFVPYKYKKYNEYDSENIFEYDEVINSFIEGEVENDNEQID